MLPLHPITNDYHDFTGEETVAMREDLRKHGLQMPILIWNGQIVDGRHRAKLCEELGISAHYSNISDKTEEQMRALVRSLNEHRRANTKARTRAEKTASVKAALEKDPARSDRAIAEECDVDDKTVAKKRKQIQVDSGGAEIRTSDRKSKSGKKGEGQHKASARSAAQTRPPAPGRKKTTSITPALNSLAWSEATAAQRTKFISDVSVKSIWKAMTDEHKNQLYDIAAAEEAKQQRPAAAH